MKQKNWMLLVFAGVVSVFSLVSFPALAQDYVYATGNPNFGVNYPISGGYVNVTNGNVHITIPLGTFKQRGELPPVKINLEYDSRIWQIVDNGGYSWQPVNVPNSMSGWRLTTGLEQGTTSYRSFSQQGTQSVTCQVGHLFIQDFYESWMILTAFQWTDAEGTVHVFNGQTEEPLRVCNGDTSHTQPNTSAYAIDGSGYYVKITSYYQMTVYDNQGNEVYPERADPNGNTVTISNGTVTDSMGWTLVTATSGTNTITYNVLKEGGGTNAFTVNTEPINVATSFQEPAVSEFNGSLTAVQSIDFPDGSTSSFTYDSGTSPGNYGEVESMTLPTGGVVSLGYTNYLDSYQNENRWISTETETSNTTTFTPAVLTQCSSGGVGCQEQMTVARPAGDSRVYMLTLNNGAWDGETDTYLGAPQSSTKLMTVVNNYNFTSYPCINSWICTGAMYVTASSSTATLTDVSPNLTAQTVYTSSAPWTGKISTVQEFDYGASSPTRETDYTYGYTLNGASLLTQENKKFNGNAFAQTIYTYSNGNMTSRVEGLPGDAQAATSYAYDSNGVRTSRTDPNGNTTSYAYSCSDGYVAQTTYPVTSGVNHITNVNPDCSSGDPLSKTDQNGQVTTYAYDSIGRRSSINYPDGGQTSYSYPSPSEVVENKLLSGSTYSTVAKNWDGYGRENQVSQSDPAGIDTVSYSYDADNRLQCTSNPQRSGSAPTNGNTCYTYDALDRATLVTQPDGNTIQVAYSGNQATVTDENGHQKRYQYDAFHDMTAVWEPNASGAPSWETSYAYDAAGHVTNITQVGDGSSAARVRTFVYDSLGRMTSESTPEPGAKSYTYDANGNVKSSASGLGTITYNLSILKNLQKAYKSR